MKKIIYLSALLSMIFSLPLNAMHYFNGQKEYLENCRVCHKGSSIFVSKYSVKEWNKLFDNDGIKLVEIHADIKDVEVDKEDIDVNKIKSYFKSERYVHKIKYYQAFIEHFAKDGTINSED